VIPHCYTLWIRDNKGEFDNIVLVNSYEADQREEAFAAVKALKAIGNETVTVWLEVDGGLTPSSEDIADEIVGVP
jgi:hypothetical protein